MAGSNAPEGANMSFVAIFFATLAAMMAHYDISRDPIFAVNYLSHSSRSTPYGLVSPSQSSGNHQSNAPQPSQQNTGNCQGRSADIPSSARTGTASIQPAAHNRPAPLRGYGQGRSAYIPPHMRGVRTAPVPAPAQSTLPPRSAPQPPSNPYSLAPTYAPILNEHLPLELQNLVYKYQVACFFLLQLLLKYGIAGTVAGVQQILGLGGVPRPLEVQFRTVNDNGMSAKIPYVLGGQYMDLYDSIRRRYRGNPSALRSIRRELRTWADIAVEGRAAVHDWHQLLPANDARVADNPRHAAFLQTLITLRDRL